MCLLPPKRRPGCLIMGRPRRIKGYLGKIRSDLGRKQPKTCVWVLAVSEKVKRGILQRSPTVSLMLPAVAWRLDGAVILHTLKMSINGNLSILLIILDGLLDHWIKTNAAGNENSINTGTICNGSIYNGPRYSPVTREDSRWSLVCIITSCLGFICRNQ